MDRSKRPTIVEALYSYEIGGGERVAADAALGFARRGFRVLCVGMYGDRGPLRDELEAHGLACHNFDYTQRSRWTRRFTYQREFMRFLQREQVNALHMHYGTSLMIAGRAAQRAGVRRVVMTEHALHQYQERPDYARATAAVAHYAHAITVVDASQTGYMATALGIPHDRLHYVPNGISIPHDAPVRAAELRRSLGAAPDDFVIAAIGRLHETKDLPVLVDAFARAAGGVGAPRLRLWLIGDGPDRERIRAAVEAHSIGERVTFLGVRTDVPRLLSAIDAVAMSSKTEGLPMTLIEAMAHRVPCVATAVGGIPQLFADGAGVLVPASDAAALASALGQLSTDPALCARIGDAGLARVRQRHDIETSITRYLQLLGLPAEWP
jgi:glycosyltransferase involved in cell wall biosynthesis